MHRKSLLAAGLGAALAGAGYAFYEPYRYRLSCRDLDIASGARLTVLHLSDTHMSGGDGRLVRWLEALPEMLSDVPDLVLATGDLIQGDDGIGPLVAALGDIEARLGRFYVLGSHDYYQSSFQSYTKYWTARRGEIRAAPADTKRLEDGLQAGGWVSLNNRTEMIESEQGRIRLAGVDDPYLDRHSTGHIERASSDVAAIGLVHAPDVVSQWLLNGFDLVVAGHTHGGQVRLPLVGAVVTNCSLPATLASGAHRIGSGWLHVSPGLGSGRFSPIRFNCRPEATLLRLGPSCRNVRAAAPWETG